MSTFPLKKGVAGARVTPNAGPDVINFMRASTAAGSWGRRYKRAYFIRWLRPLHLMSPIEREAGVLQRVSVFNGPGNIYGGLLFCELYTTPPPAFGSLGSY